MALILIVTFPVRVVFAVPLRLMDILIFGRVSMLLDLIERGLILVPTVLSRFCVHGPLVRHLIGWSGLPLIVGFGVLLALVPAVTAPERLAARRMLLESWPFCWPFWRLLEYRRLPSELSLNRELEVVLSHLGSFPALRERVMDKLLYGESLDPPR